MGVLQKGANNVLACHFMQHQVPVFLSGDNELY